MANNNLTDSNQQEAKLNQLVALLGADDFLNKEKGVFDSSFDLILLAGNSLPYLADFAADLMDEGVADTLLISGGYGHATEPLIVNIKEAERLLKVADLAALSEAQLLEGLVEERRKTTGGRLILEESSTNTGENAAFSKVLIDELPQISRVLLLQDPLLLRRTKVTFQYIFEGCRIEFFACAPKLPLVDTISEKEIHYRDATLNGAWEREYFLSVLMGEIRRLQDTEVGYGPRGAGFIPHVAIPAPVLAAYRSLQGMLRLVDR